MYELADAIPDPDVLLGLSPEELGGKILFVLRERIAHQRSNPADGFSPYNLTLEFWNSSIPLEYRQKSRNEIDLAIGEAWAWLQAQGLIVPLVNVSGSAGWFRLSRRAQSFENAAEFSRFAVARMLPKETLHAPPAANSLLASQTSG